MHSFGTKTSECRCGSEDSIKHLVGCLLVHIHWLILNRCCCLVNRWDCVKQYAFSREVLETSLHPVSAAAMLRASATTSTSARYARSARPSIACRALPQARLANTTPPCSDQQQQQYAPASWTRRMLSAAAAATCAAMLAMPQPALALPPGKADVTPQQLVEIIKGAHQSRFRAAGYGSEHATSCRSGLL